MAAPHGQKPSQQEWLAGRWAQEIRSLQVYALTEQDPEMPFTFPEALLDVMKPFTGGSLRAIAAGELLKQLGVWSLHEHVPLLRERLTEQFEPDLLVCQLLLSRRMPQINIDHNDMSIRRCLNDLRAQMHRSYGWLRQAFITERWIIEHIRIA